jgi:hypothetical protein
MLQSPKSKIKTAASAEEVGQGARGLTSPSSRACDAEDAAAAEWGWGRRRTRRSGGAAGDVGPACGGGGGAGGEARGPRPTAEAAAGRRRQREARRAQAMRGRRRDVSVSSPAEEALLMVNDLGVGFSIGWPGGGRLVCNAKHETRRKRSAGLCECEQLLLGAHASWKAWVEQELSWRRELNTLL